MMISFFFFTSRGQNHVYLLFCARQIFLVYSRLCYPPILFAYVSVSMNYKTMNFELFASLWSLFL